MHSSDTPYMKRGLLLDLRFQMIDWPVKSSEQG
jgi:hypothetical protein